MRAWVANYEISAFLKQRPDSSKVGFIRLVQLSDLAVATHEVLLAGRVTELRSFRSHLGLLRR